MRLKLNLNYWSFIFSLVSIVFFLIFLVSDHVMNWVSSFTGINPLSVVFFITIINLFLGLIGLKDVKGWKTMSRSLLTLFITCVLLGIVSFILMAEVFFY